MAKILVVDDEPDLELLLRQKFRRKVRKGRMQLIFAQNGIEALERLKEHPDVDMVLSDINMPEMDGLTLLQQLEKAKSNVRAVIVTAYGDMKNIRIAMNRGAFDFITKPIDFKDLETTITKTLAHLAVMRDALRSRDELVALRKELGVAARMQESILPTSFPKHSAYDIYARMTPAQDVGGDFYDFFPLEDGRMGLVVADVSGKGIPAALFMMVTRTLMKGAAIGDDDPQECLAEVNDLLSQDNEEAMFVTIFYAILDPASGVVRYANAGHNLPMVARASGKIEKIDCSAGLVMGVFPNFPFPGGEVRLDPGDAFFLYTDGVTEAMDPQSVEYGEERLEGVLGECVGASAIETCDRVFGSVEKHAGSAPQSDDITCMAVRYKGSG